MCGAKLGRYVLWGWDDGLVWCWCVERCYIADVEDDGGTWRSSR
jgi:hypothetical protein